MPGIVAFQRRWSVGSDDLVVPGLFLFFVHLIWIVVLSIILAVVEFDQTEGCVHLLWEYMLGYLVIIVVSLLVELLISLTSLRGSILDTEKRKSVPCLIYIRLAVLLLELGWLILGGVWIGRFYTDCPASTAKDALLGLVICSSLVMLSVFITIWCTFDPAGRSWVKMMNYQRSMRESESRFQYRRSGSCTRTWRQRKVLRAYQDSWDQRCRLLFCCMRHSDRSQNSFGDIARLLSDFFRDIDVVPSDVVAGLILLRKYQKIERESIVKQRLNDTYEYLSGVAVTSDTQFLALNDPVHYAFFQDVIHYMNFALGAYGWPVYVMGNPTVALCRLCSKLRCSCFPCCATSKKSSAVIIKDNCCECNYTALKQQVETDDIQVVYATFHVDVGITPFFVAVDYSRKKIIVSIRGTLSLQDVITDLNAEGETIPINPPREDWVGHKGMVQVAVHIQNKLLSESILNQAFNHNPQRGTQNFKLVIVGHSLGAGAASILSILLRQHYPDLVCFSYSPPGGTISISAAEYTKSFITSVVVGKDVVPRIGLHQMESLRADLMHAIKRSKDPKWKTISCSVMCCGCAGLPTSAAELQADDSMQMEYKKDKDKAREYVFHSQSNVTLTSHQPLYPPGRIIHIVRHHTKKKEQKYEKRWRQLIQKRKPVYQALWANNTDFDEVLISPVMIQDHMPDNVLAALNKVLKYEKGRTMTYSIKMAVATASAMSASPVRSTEPPEIPEYVKEFERLFFRNIDNGRLDPENGSSLSEVITTVGPRKPQRTAVFSNVAAEQEHNDSENCHLLPKNSLSSPKVNTPPHRLQLETSFTSLLSPNDKTTCKISLQSFGSHSSNNTNTITTNSLMKNDSVNFRHVKSDIHSPPAKNLIPWEYQSVLEEQEKLKEQKPDLIHDDWLGLAPLATPESLSEVSSISSRASSMIIHSEKGSRMPKTAGRRLGCFRSPREPEKPDKSFKGFGFREQLSLKNKQCDNSDSSDSYLDSPPMRRNPTNLESLLTIDSRKSSSGDSSYFNYGLNSPDHENFHETQRSPRILRRTPKIAKGLATAGEDVISSKKFEEMMKSITRAESYENTSGETGSFVSARSHDIERSSSELYKSVKNSPKSCCGERRSRTYYPQEENLDVMETELKDRASAQKSWRDTPPAEDLNYHKPTLVILPTDKNLPPSLSHIDITKFQTPYLETDFSLSDPDLNIMESKEIASKPEKKIKFVSEESKVEALFEKEKLGNCMSFDQDYEFDIETESTKLIGSNNASESSLLQNASRNLLPQDSCFRDEDSLEDGSKPEDYPFYLASYDSKSSPELKRLKDNKCHSDKNKSYFSSRSAEALPLLTTISENFRDRRRKYSFSILRVNKGESSV